MNCIRHAFIYIIVCGNEILHNIKKKNYILHVHVYLITGTFKFLCVAVISENILIRSISFEHV